MQDEIVCRVDDQVQRAEPLESIDRATRVTKANIRYYEHQASIMPTPAAKDEILKPVFPGAHICQSVAGSLV